MILVTGASGFLGRHLVRALATHFPAEPRHLFDLRPSADAVGARFISGSIEDRGAVSAAVRGARVVIHLAAHVQPESRDVEQMTRINTIGACNVFAAAVDAGCELFVQMSSAGVYGPPRGPEPFREVDAADPQTPYQRAKFAAEQRLLDGNARNTALVILRPAGIYGSGSLLEIPTYRRVRRQRWSLELRGGVVVHPTHVSDVVDAIIAVVIRPATHGSAFNVGGERPILVADLHALVADALGVRRRRVVLSPTVAGPCTDVAAFLLRRTGRVNAHVQAFSRGEVVSAAVDDGVFRERYPLVPIKPLRDGIREHVDWARAQSLL